VAGALWAWNVSIGKVFPLSIPAGLLSEATFAPVEIA
jgi:hypothetical protein